MLVSVDFGVGEERDHSFLKGAETMLDFTLGLWCGRDEVGDAKPAQSPLKLAFGIAVIVAGARAEEAQAICVNCVGSP